LELPTPCNRADADAARDLMVAYVTDSCSLAEGLEFEVHCLACDECATTLTILQDLLRSPGSKEEEKTLAQLYPMGMEAARIARRRSGMEVSMYDEKISPSESPFSAGRIAAVAL